MSDVLMISDARFTMVVSNNGRASLSSVAVSDKSAVSGAFL